MKDKRDVSRRDFLQRLGALGLVGIGAGSFLAGCGGGGGDQQNPGTANQPGSGGGNSACADISGLSEQEVQTRTTLNYVNQTPKPDQRCDGCQFWVAQEAGKPCGGCQIVKGPIDPGGWCSSWAPQMA